VPDATASLSVLVADTSFVTASQNMVVAEEMARTTELQPAIAATLTSSVDTDVAVAAQRARTLGLDVFASGSAYLLVSMRAAVAEAEQLVADADVAVAGTSAKTTSLNVSLSDAAPILLEPDAPKTTPLLTVDDLMVTGWNAITSAADFIAAGVRVGDVLELVGGANRGNYMVAGVQENVLFVSQAFINTIAVGPFSGEVRTGQTVSAVATAAVVIDQAVFLAPFQLSCVLNVAVD